MRLICTVLPVVSFTLVLFVGKKRINQAWLKEFIQEHKPSIEFLELFAVTAAVISWIHQFKNRRIMLLCDNKSVVDMINLTTTSCKNCMVLIRFLWFG